MIKTSKRKHVTFTHDNSTRSTIVYSDSESLPSVRYRCHRLVPSSCSTQVPSPCSSRCSSVSRQTSIDFGYKSNSSEKVKNNNFRKNRNKKDSPNVSGFLDVVETPTISKIIPPVTFSNSVVKRKSIQHTKTTFKKLNLNVKFSKEPPEEFGEFGDSESDFDDELRCTKRRLLIKHTRGARIKYPNTILNLKNKKNEYFDDDSSSTDKNSNFETPVPVSSPKSLLSLHGIIYDQSWAEPEREMRRVHLIRNRRPTGGVVPLLSPEGQFCLEQSSKEQKIRNKPTHIKKKKKNELKTQQKNIEIKKSVHFIDGFYVELSNDGDPNFDDAGRNEERAKKCRSRVPSPYPPRIPYISNVDSREEIIDDDNIPHAVTFTTQNNLASFAGSPADEETGIGGNRWKSSERMMIRRAKIRARRPTAPPILTTMQKRQIETLIRLSDDDNDVGSEAESLSPEVIKPEESVAVKFLSVTEDINPLDCKEFHEPERSAIRRWRCRYRKLTPLSSIVNESEENSCEEDDEYPMVSFASDVHLKTSYQEDLNKSNASIDPRWTHFNPQDVDRNDDFYEPERVSKRREKIRTRIPTPPHTLTQQESEELKFPDDSPKNYKFKVSTLDCDVEALYSSASLSPTSNMRSTISNFSSDAHIVGRRRILKGPKEESEDSRRRSSSEESVRINPRHLCPDLYRLDAYQQVLERAASISEMPVILPNGVDEDDGWADPKRCEKRRMRIERRRPTGPATMTPEELAYFADKEPECELVEDVETHKPPAVTFDTKAPIVHGGSGSNSCLPFEDPRRSALRSKKIMERRPTPPRLPKRPNTDEVTNTHSFQEITKVFKKKKCSICFSTEGPEEVSGCLLPQCKSKMALASVDDPNCWDLVERQIVRSGKIANLKATGPAHMSNNELKLLKNINKDLEDAEIENEISINRQQVTFADPVATFIVHSEDWVERHAERAARLRARRPSGPIYGDMSAFINAGLNEDDDSEGIASVAPSTTWDSASNTSNLSDPNASTPISQYSL